MSFRSLPSLTVVLVAACHGAQGDSVVVVIPTSLRGPFAVYYDGVSPDRLGVGNRETVVPIPSSGILVTNNMDCLDEWVSVSFEDDAGRRLDDCRPVLVSSRSDLAGRVMWFFRGPADEELGFFYGPANSGRMRVWLEDRGIGSK